MKLKYVKVHSGLRGLVSNVLMSDKFDLEFDERIAMLKVTDNKGAISYTFTPNIVEMQPEDSNESKTKRPGRPSNADTKAAAKE